MNRNEIYKLVLYGLFIAITAVLGLVSLIILITIEKSKPTVYESGSFGNIQPPSLSYARAQISINRSKAFHLSPSVLIFIIISAIVCIAAFVM